MIFSYLQQGIREKAVKKKMEQIYFGARINALRKQKGLTQEALAQKLGITNQAVSKWESDQCCPDIMQLPALADIFEISMDELFGRKPPETPSANTIVNTLPWADDKNLHAVCYVGHNLVKFRELPTVGGTFGGYSYSCMGFDKKSPWGTDPVQLEYSGEVGNIYSDFSVICKESRIQGNIQAGDSITCADVGGQVNAAGSVTCGNITGNAFAGDSLNCVGLIGCNAQAGDSIHCEGYIGAAATAGGDIECGGDIYGRVNAEGDITCRGNMMDDVRADGDVQCFGDITGSVEAEGDVRCTGEIGGNVTAEGDITCTQILGNATADGDIYCN